ncbi:hypothetical protein [uncultured Bifidobacterium sp.]|uniref:hypothetical protein n=1 Tax=uncultured Bifidobacterium sp. TaxID=165187 RepID=UPI00258E8E60|nr:hypothetical protein [uncultured Bifidobacterium sp.]
MAGQEQQPVDNNLLFPIAPSSGGDPSAADDAGTQHTVPSPLSDEPAGLHDAIDIPAPPQAADTALEQQAPQDTADTDQPAANESGVLPGDIVDTNWNIPLITFPTWGSLLDNNAEQDDNAGNKTGQPADESAAQDNQVAPPTVFTPFVPSEPEPDTQAASTQDTTKSKTEQWLNAAAQDRGMHETQQINAVQPDPSATAVAGISQTASGAGIVETAALNNSAPVAAQTQPVRQSAGPALLTPPTPSERDLQHERTANAETETMTPISSAAVVAGTAAIAANVAAPGAVKTTATRTLHTTSETPTPANDAVGSLSEELREEDARAASQPIQPEESYGDKRNKGGRARSRAIVTVFVIITIAAAAAGLYYLTGLIRTNRDRSSAYASCTQAYSAYKEESETLAKTLKTSKAQQKVGADQVADVMTVEHLKTAVDKAKSVSKPVTCSTSMSTEAMRKAAETNKTLTTELTTANSTIKAAAKEVKASVTVKQNNDYDTAVNTLKTSTSEATTLMTNSEGVVADDQTRTTLQSAIDAANELLKKDKPALADLQKAQSDLQSASDAVNDSMETYKTQRAAADAAAAASAAQAQVQAQQQAQQQQSQRRYSYPSSTPRTDENTTQNNSQGQHGDNSDNSQGAQTPSDGNTTSDGQQSKSPSPSASATE